MLTSRYEIECNLEKQYRFRLIALSGATLLTGNWCSEKHDVLQGINNVQLGSRKRSNFFPSITPNGRYYFDLRLTKNVIATSQRYLDVRCRDLALTMVLHTGTTHEIRMGSPFDAESGLVK